jgi:hypothetical protein
VVFTADNVIAWPGVQQLNAPASQAAYPIYFPRIACTIYAGCCGSWYYLYGVVALCIAVYSAYKRPQQPLQDSSTWHDTIQ